MADCGPGLGVDDGGLEFGCSTVLLDGWAAVSHTRREEGVAAYCTGGLQETLQSGQNARISLVLE